jgi:hypothetical protein
LSNPVLSVGAAVPAILKSPTLHQEICDELPNGDKWLITPHALFGGKTPEQMLTSGELEAVRNLFESVLYIGIS